jgi:hypothetical protein
VGTRTLTPGSMTGNQQIYGNRRPARPNNTKLLVVTIRAR